jgi:hypothetical protein
MQLSEYKLLPRVNTFEQFTAGINSGVGLDGWGGFGWLLPLFVYDARLLLAGIFRPAFAKQAAGL